ncbi:hypothetical protein [Ruminococcus sp. Marseille-P6503]|uniref:hypothetical protein n=1 Tax=Ruminococcus sp. Marseille-P6503 TaxID=2364796 RepID=UPI000F54B40A|nr:hypothetical protein [Ruminococcus sp. Marseille-P6503]
MKKIIKRTFCAALAAIMMTGTFMTADAVRKCTKNNTGNSCKYKGSIDISLGWYKSPDKGLGDVYSDHYVGYSKPSATFSPYNNKTSQNTVVWYAEWKENGTIKDKKTHVYTMANNKWEERDLSKGMKLSTWDSDVTYFRTDIYPQNGISSENKIYSDSYKRRASTDITH